jgi:hypothetical protein
MVFFLYYFLCFYGVILCSVFDVIKPKHLGIKFPNPQGNTRLAKKIKARMNLFNFFVYLFAPIVLPILIFRLLYKASKSLVALVKDAELGEVLKISPGNEEKQPSTLSLIDKDDKQGNVSLTGD